MKNIYRNMRNHQFEIKDPPSLMEVNNFWRQILEKDIVLKQDAVWIWEIKNAFNHIEPCEWKDFTHEEIIEAIKQTSNWSSPGLDMLHNFLIKILTALHPTQFSIS